MAAQVGQGRQRVLGRVTCGSPRSGGTGTGCAAAAQRIGGAEAAGWHVGWFATTAASRPWGLIPGASLRVAGCTELTGRPNAVAGRSLRLFGPGCRGRTCSSSARWRLCGQGVTERIVFVTALGAPTRGIVGVIIPVVHHSPWLERTISPGGWPVDRSWSKAL